MDSVSDGIKQFFGVVARGRTYTNMLYLLLAFPLGIAYFVLLITGLSVGIPLVILWIGIVILLAVFGMWYGLAAFERQMAIGLLGEQIPPMSYEDKAENKNILQRFIAAMANPVTWKGLLFLLAKFPMGIISFTLLVTLLSLSGAFLTMPFYYQWVNPEVNLQINQTLYVNPVWIVDTLPEAMIGAVFGALLLIVSMHILNGLAWLSGKFARIMLGNFSTPKPLEAPVMQVSNPGETA